MTDSFETGGSERQFVALARSLNPQRFRLQLGCLQATGGFLQGFQNVESFTLGGSLYRAQSVRTRWRLARHLRQHDVAIAHDFDFYTNLTLIPAARLARVPVVIGSQRQMGDLLTRAQSYAQAAAFHLCDRVVCNSRAAASRLIDQGVSEHKLAVIGNGLFPEAFSKTQPALSRLPGSLRVGMIARMNAPYKNHHIFLNVAARLSASIPDLEFVLVGDGPLRPELEQRVERLQLGGRVHFLGDRKDIAEILASMDVSVIPSASESLSNAALESMAAGVPVVATSIGGNVELLTAGRGVLVPANNEEALCVALEQVLGSSELRTRLAEAARQYAQSNFTIKHVQKQYEDLYTELLAQKTSKAERARSSYASGSRLRVAFVAPSLRYVGGQSVQADLLLRYWQNDPGVEPVFVPVDPRFPRGLMWIERVPGLRTIIRMPLYLKELWCALNNVDIVHIFSASYWSFLLAPTPAEIVARLRRKKTVINYHSGEARDHLQRFRTARPILRKADRLVVPSGYLVDVFKEFDLKAQVVPNVVDLSQFAFRARHPLRPHLVCTRGFNRYYSVDIVLRAFAEVQRIFPKARIDLVGGGPLEFRLRALCEDLKISGVNFVGVVSRREIASFYDRADIFINASWLDNMPVSILEAFASGTPVVTTEPEGIRYLVDHERTGLLSQMGDWRTLADNVIRLLQDPVLASRLAQNALLESHRYAWDAVRGQWLDVYRSLCDTPEFRGAAAMVVEQPSEPPSLKIKEVVFAPSARSVARNKAGQFS
jgi:glycosyltransferase involved in cell wall biosynthesis